MNFGLTFKQFEKIEVNGENAHPLFKYLKSKKRGLFGSKIKWNFTKFLIDKEGNVIARFSPTTKPAKIEKKIMQLL
jgi:glutathione peroxidase